MNEGRKMKHTVLILTAGTIALATQPALADSHAGGGTSTQMVEIITCDLKEGKNRRDLNVVIEKWNDWADDQGITDYSAWIMTPFYSGGTYDFDFAWLGSSSSAASLGRAQDAWLASGSEVLDDFNAVISCPERSAFSVHEFKQPPERDNPTSLMITFSDCNLGEGMSFQELSPSIHEWADYKGDNGSSGGMWALTPSMGGGGEGFDFKWVTAYQNLENLGKDLDQNRMGGWEKGRDLFAGKVSCDSSRVYSFTNHRMAEDDD
jgi:hypothetical protein